MRTDLGESKILRDPDFSDSQNDALVAFNKNIIVSAGAGSGKTTVLSSKVKALVEYEHISVSNMLILTFTNLAAGEMRDRIKDKLMKFDVAEAEKVDSADICTFDSFALSIVKKYHFLLGLDENIGLISDVILSAKRNKWIDEMIDELYIQFPQEFKDIVDRFVSTSDDNIKTIIKKILDKAALYDDKKVYFAPINDVEAGENFEKIFEPFKDKLMNLKDEVVDAFNNIEHKKYVEKVSEMNSTFFEARDFDELIEGISSFTLQGTGGFKVDKEQKAPFVDAKDKIIKDSYKSLSDKQTLKNEYIESQKLKNYLKALAKRIYLKEKELKESKQVYSFSDIADFAYKIVSENENILTSLRKKYRVIMVDEYQDTSYSQERFLKLFDYKSPDYKTDIFMVGDIKQSIYRFRNARPDIFQDKYEDYASGKNGIKIDLNDNFRSRESVLKDINLIFSKIMTMSSGGANYARDHMINPGNKLYNKTSINPVTEIITYPSKDENGNKYDANEIEANIIADDIINKINSGYEITVMYKDENKKNASRAEKATYSSFCIIHSQTKDFPTYLKVFEKRGIPIFIQSNEEVSTNYLIRITINALSLIHKIINSEEDGDFNHYIVSLSRSYLFNVSDEEIYKFVKSNSYKNSEVYLKFKDIIDKSKTNSIAEKIELFLNETDAFYKLLKIGNYERNSAYYDAFITYFKEMDDLNFTLEDAIDILQCIDKYKIKLNLPALETSVDAVKLINAHKSKGLEYNFVYFSNMIKQINLRDSEASFGVSLKYDITFSMKNGKATIDHLLFKEEERKESLSEYMRIFYVALTRAKEQMIFVMPDDVKEKKVEECVTFAELLTASKFACAYPKHIDNVEDVLKGNKINLGTPKKDKLRIDVTNIDLSYEEKEKKEKSSMSLSLDSSSNALHRGSDIHFLFRAIDFDTKDISSLSIKEQEIMNRFFASNLFKMIDGGKHYKEYEFENAENRGTIDLFTVLKDKIILIDYKSNDIEKSGYVDQLKIYAKHLIKVFNKPVEAYLYSISTGKEKQINID